MLSVLVDAVIEIKAERRSGLLMAFVEVGDWRDERSGVLIPAGKTDFSFFFKDGELMSTLSRGVRGGGALARVTAIQKVLRTQWTATSSGTIALTDDATGTVQLLSLLGGQAPAPVILHVPKVTQAERDKADALAARGKRLMVQFMGKNAEALFKQTLALHNPLREPEGFRRACIAELTPWIGQASAETLFPR